MSASKCPRCENTVYAVEGLKCLDKVWHKGCFKCYECGMTLSLKNHKGFDKKPYCNAHCPQAKHTSVADTPEIRRLAENTRIQSQARYHEDFEKSKGKGFTPIADDPETLRIKNTSKIISNVAYHGELERKKQMEEKRNLVEENGSITSDNNNHLDYMSPQHQQQQKPSPQSNQTSHHINQQQSNLQNSTPHQPYQQQQPQLHKQQQIIKQQQLQQQQQQQQQQQLQIQQQQQQQQQQQLQMQQQQQQQMQLQQQQIQQQHQQTLQQQQLYQQQQMHQKQQMLKQQQQQQQQQQIIMSGNTYGGDVSLAPYSGMRYPSNPYNNMKQYPTHQVPSHHPTTVHPGTQIINRIPMTQQTMIPGGAMLYNANGMVAQQPHYVGPNPRMMPPPMQYMPQARHPHQHPVTQRVFRAMYNYTASDVDEVSFMEGDLLVNCVNIDAGWMTGTVQRSGQTGMLPANYVEQVKLRN